jgi:hypothetical protein
VPVLLYGSVGLSCGVTNNGTLQCCIPSIEQLTANGIKVVILPLLLNATSWLQVSDTSGAVPTVGGGDVVSTLSVSQLNATSSSSSSLSSSLLAQMIADSRSNLLIHGRPCTVKPFVGGLPNSAHGTTSTGTAPVPIPFVQNTAESVVALIKALEAKSSEASTAGNSSDSSNSKPATFGTPVKGAGNVSSTTNSRPLGGTGFRKY